MFRRVAADLYRLVAESPEATIAENSAPSIPANLPVRRGDLIGLRTGSVSPIVDYYSSSSPGDEIAGALGDPALGQTVGPGGDYPSFTDAPFRVNASAVLTSSTNAGTCKNTPSTITGTSGSDSLVGTAGPDVIAALGGNDKVSGLGSKDLICGGPGNDKLKGGPGKDTLFGQDGTDILKGGGADDLCNGGRGRDSRSNC